MLAAKSAIVLATVLLVVEVISLFGPGPLVPGLGPVFDQLPSILLGGTLLLLVIPLLRRAVRGSLPVEIQSTTRAAAEPQQILRERYARGELSRDEFLRMQNDLRSESAPQP